MKRTIGLAATLLAVPVSANDWEKFYKPISSPSVVASTIPAEIINSSGNVNSDVETMWRKGYAPVGYSSFNTGNSKTGDALKMANKIHARYVIVATQLTSSRSSSIPITTPTTTTSLTNGTVSASGTGGYANGNYSGTTTTYGSQTDYIPITINRFDKMGLYFKEVPRRGTGIFPRELTPVEVGEVYTRRAFAVRFVRDGSPAYQADVLPEDIILTVNGKPADATNWQEAIAKVGDVAVHLIRRGQPRDLVIKIPSEWVTP